MQTSSPLIGERELSKLKWRCRRGLLENDLFIERFFKRYEASLTVDQAQAVTDLMDLSERFTGPVIGTERAARRIGYRRCHGAPASHACQRITLN